MASTQSQTQAARGADPDADPDSGPLGDIHAAACRAELRRMADALGTRARYGCWERLRRAPLRASRSRPSAAVSRATGPYARARHPAQTRRASCKAVERRALSPSAAQGVPNGLEGIPGTLRQFQALYGPYSGRNFVLIGLKGDKCGGFGHNRHGARTKKTSNSAGRRRAQEEKDVSAYHL